MRTVQVKDIILGTGRPKICVPLTGATRKALVEEANRVKDSAAELAEWRIDWFEAVDQIEVLEETSKELRQILGRMPFLMTFRTKEEGGQKAIELKEYEVLLLAICERKMADLIDVELFRGETIVKNIQQAAKKAGMFTIGSSHDFTKTPEREEIIHRLCKMQDLGLDITKIAVMPQSERDVLTLLDATLAMKESYADRPFITMAMNRMGIVSRMAGECFGSCLTFGTVGNASAPGQIDAADLSFVLELLHRG